MTLSYRGFYRAMNIQYSSQINHHTISIINNYTKSYVSNGRNKLNDFLMVSIANKTPIAQFMVDTYTLSVSKYKYNLTINEFMQKSKFLSRLYKSHDMRPWQLIRGHLSEYLTNIYKPIHQNMFIADDDDDDDEQDEYDNDHGTYYQIPVPQHNMAGILYYISVIHENIYILNKVCQIDIIFIPQLLEQINAAYFDKLNIKYDTLGNIKQQYIKEMMRRFNEKLDGNEFRRCIILIMDNNDVCKDTVYIFEPLADNRLPPEIYQYTEMPWICNTKSNILPDLDIINDYHPLCLSIHRHKNGKHCANIERVYVSYHSYGSRVFKHNLKSMLSPFCMRDEQEYPIIDWEDEMEHKEFKDPEYSIFIDTYFADLHLIKPSIYHYEMNHLHDEHRWSQLLYKYIIHDRISCILSVREYMYIPTPIEYYKAMNNIIGRYYKSMDIEYNDIFITYIYDNEFQDCPLNDNLGSNIDVDDCLLLEFDPYFPIIDNNANRDEFIFQFLQNCYLYGTAVIGS